MNRLKSSLEDLRKYPSAMAGVFIIVGLILLAVYAMVSIPFSEALRLWRGGEEVWRESPRNARPEWVNWFSSTKLPSTVVLRSTDPQVEKTVEPLGDLTDVTITYTFDFQADGFPQGLSLFYTADFDRRQPFAEMLWIKPNGDEVRIGDVSPRARETYRFDQESRLLRRLGGLPPRIGLFVEDTSAEQLVPLKGTYQLQVQSILFEEDSDIDAMLVVYGQVAGMAGTDHQRRDLTVALLWGTPIALAFGLLAAVGTTVTTMVIAAIGVWFGGWVDATIQRVTEVNIILPVLPILIMVGTFYSRSIWVILGVVILLNIFSAGIITFRAIFLQVKESGYIEAAQAYGASSWRIVVYYMLPRVIPLLIPTLVTLIPTFVFLEATLAVLGLGDPVLPTWGKIIDDAYRQGALFNGYYYWVLEPAAMLMITGLGFAMVGFALDRVFNPRLRGL
jgi:peptide/nickel transport system permease protein